LGFFVAFLIQGHFSVQNIFVLVLLDLTKEKLHVIVFVPISGFPSMPIPSCMSDLISPTALQSLQNQTLILCDPLGYAVKGIPWKQIKII
jgi:hypothetical protein